MNRKRPVRCVVTDTPAMRKWVSIALPVGVSVEGELTDELRSVGLGPVAAYVLLSVNRRKPGYRLNKPELDVLVTALDVVDGLADVVSDRNVLMVAALLCQFRALDRFNLIDRLWQDEPAICDAQVYGVGSS